MAVVGEEGAQCGPEVTESVDLLDPLRKRLGVRRGEGGLQHRIGTLLRGASPSRARLASSVRVGALVISTSAPP